MSTASLVNHAGESIADSLLEPFRASFQGVLIRPADAGLRCRAQNLEREHRQEARSDRAMLGRRGRDRGGKFRPRK